LYRLQLLLAEDPGNLHNQRWLWDYFKEDFTAWEDNFYYWHKIWICVLSDEKSVG
jgi:hypothetical protein